MLEEADPTYMYVDRIILQLVDLRWRSLLIHMDNLAVQPVHNVLIHHCLTSRLLIPHHSLTSHHTRHLLIPHHSLQDVQHVQHALLVLLIHQYMLQQAQQARLDQSVQVFRPII